MTNPVKRNRKSGNIILIVAVLTLLNVVFQTWFHHFPAGTPSGMATIACSAVVRVPGNTLVIVVHLALIIVRMAIDATEYLVIVRVCVAVGTKIPFTGMMPGVDREILTIMVKSGGYPGGSGMTRLAFSWELR
jgi:hypothetical protein